jgi:SIR2-like domain/NACHT domain
MTYAIPPNLIERFQKGEVIVVTGTGVTAASVSAEQRGVASWAGLIKHGLEFCRTVAGSNAAQIDIFLEVLNGNNSTLDDMFDAANYVSRRLKKANPPRFDHWLDAAVGTLTLSDRTLIDAIAALKCPILTLNYDSLIQITLGRDVTKWNQPNIAQAVVRQDFNRVLHLHGHYADSETVILSDADYATIKADDAIQAILDAIVVTKTLLFIGCGETLNDPNWKPLLDKLEGIFAVRDSQSLYRHYLLVRDVEVEKFNGINSQIVVVPYGRQYQDLPEFLAQLAAQNPSSTTGTTSNTSALVAQAAALDRYKLWAKEEHSTIKNYLMNKPIPFDGLFAGVQLLDKPEAMRMHSIEAFEKQTVLDHFGRDRNALPKDALEVVKKTTHLYVLGKPGAGKTTFLKHVLRYTLEDMPEMVPFFVSLKEWSELGGDLASYLKNQLVMGSQGFFGVDRFLKQTLDSGHAMVLLDGLDEVNMEAKRRSEIVELIKAFCMAHHNNRFVLTCRVAAHEYNFEHFQYVQVADFSSEQITIFINRWFSEKPLSGELLLGELQKPEHAGYLELAGVPLLLTLLCVGFEEANEFPKRKSEVYLNALAALLLKWDNSKNITRGKTAYWHYKQLSLERKHQLFEKIAYDWFVKGKIFFETTSLAKQIEAYLDKIPAAEREEKTIPTIGVGADILQAIEEQHGILIPRSRDVHSFAHLTFQEYYTSRFIAQHANKSNLVNLISHVTDTKWREVLLLTVSELSDENTTFFLHLWKLYIDKLLQNEKLNIIVFTNTKALDGNYVSFALGYISVKVAHDRIRDLALARTRAIARELEFSLKTDDYSRSLALDLELELALNIELEFAFTRTLALEIDHAAVLEIAVNRRLAIDRVLYQDRNLALGISFNRISENEVNRRAMTYALSRATNFIIDIDQKTSEKIQKTKSRLRGTDKLTSQDFIETILQISIATYKSYKGTQLGLSPLFLLHTVYEISNQAEKIRNPYFKDHRETILSWIEIMHTNLLELIVRDFKPESRFKSEIEYLNLISELRSQETENALKAFHNICNKHLNNIFEPLDEETSKAIIEYLNHILTLNTCLNHMAIDEQTHRATQNWFFTKLT